MKNLIKLALCGSALLLLNGEISGMKNNHSSPLNALDDDSSSSDNGIHIHIPSSSKQQVLDNYRRINNNNNNDNDNDNSNWNDYLETPNNSQDDLDQPIHNNLPQNPYKQRNNGNLPEYNGHNNIPCEQIRIPYGQLYIPPQLNQPQTFDFNNTYQSPFSIPKSSDNNNNNNDNDNDNSNWNDYLETPHNSQDGLNLPDANANDNYDEYENISRKFKARIPQMDMENVQAYLISVEAEINECKKELNDKLAILQATDDGDDASVQQLAPQIEDLRDQINNFRETRDLLQKRKQELMDQMCSKDRMILITQETLSDNDVSSDQRTDETIDDTFQKIGREINRIGKQFEQQIGKPVEKAVQDFRDGTVKPVLKNIEKFFKKL